MRILCSAVCLLLGVGANAFVVGPSNTGNRFSMQQRVQGFAPFMSEEIEQAPVAVDTESSEEHAPESEDAPVALETESTAEPAPEDEKPSFKKERHTIYVGNLPYGIAMPEIKDLFAAHCTVQYVSLPRNTETGEIKGFAFVDVATEEDITKAVEALNQFEMDGRPLRVSKVLPKDEVRSMKKSKVDDANKLFVGNLDFSATVEEIRDTFSEFGTVTDVFIPKNSMGQSRGFAFVTVGEGEVESVMEAADGVEMLGRTLVVKPPLAPGEKTERKKRDPRPNRQKLYVGNLSFYTNEETLMEVFEEFGTVFDCYIPEDPERGSSRGFGFITMDVDAANEAIDALDGCELDGRIIAVNPARMKGGPVAKEEEEEVDETE